MKLAFLGTGVMGNPMCSMTTETYAQAIEAYGFDANHLKAVRLLEEQNNTYLRG